jgi:hypothetical protein
MSGFWKRLMGRREEAAQERAEAEAYETPAERRFSEESIDSIAADEVVEERLGGTDPQRLVDDEFKP